MSGSHQNHMKCTHFLSTRYVQEKTRSQFSRRVGVAACVRPIEETDGTLDVLSVELKRGVRAADTKRESDDHDPSGPHGTKRGLDTH